MHDEPQRRFPVAGNATVSLRDGSMLDASSSVLLTVAEQDLSDAIVRAPGVRRLVACEKSHRVEDLARAGAAGAWSCVLIGSGGSPTPIVRQFIRTTSATLGVPVYVLADNDPGGFDVFFLVQRGTSGRRRPRPELATPGARFLGITSAQAATVPETHGIPLTEDDERRLLQLARHPWVRSDARWRHEIEAMRKRGYKVELEAAVCSESIDAFVAAMARTLEVQS